MVGSESLREELNNRGNVSFVPVGNSMWPTIKNGKQAVVVRKKEGRLSPFDCVLYLRDDGQAVLHRVLLVTDFGYITCGDSQFIQEKVMEDQAIGVLVGFCRGKKFIDAESEKEKSRAKKWYEHKARRKFIVKTHFFFRRLGIRIKKLVTLEYFKRKKDV